MTLPLYKDKVLAGSKEEEAENVEAGFVTENVS